MNQFIEIMQNTWVVGITGGIISGIIVYYITSYVLDRKKKSEHKRSIAMANNAVLDILRPYIANFGLPDKKQLETIVNSTSRQYGVKSSEINSIRVFYEDLVVEFIGNLYIPDDIKRKNIEILLKNIEIIERENVVKIEQKQTPTIKGKTGETIGVLVGFLSAMISIFTGVIGSRSGKGSFNLIVGLISVIAIFIIVIIGIWSSLKAYRLEKKYRDSSFYIKSNYFVNSEHLRMINSGTDMNTLFESDFSFINYFDDEDGYV